MHQTDSRCLLCCTTSQWFTRHVWHQNMLCAWSKWSGWCSAWHNKQNNLWAQVVCRKFAMSLLLFVSFAALFCSVHCKLLYTSKKFTQKEAMLPFLLLSVLLHSLCPLCITHPNGPHTLCSFTNVANCMKPLCKRTFTYSEQQPLPKMCMCHDQICIPRGHSL